MATKKAKPGRTLVRVKGRTPAFSGWQIEPPPGWSKGRKCYRMDELTVTEFGKLASEKYDAERWHNDSLRRRPAQSWDLNTNRNQSAEMARTGWKEGVAEAKKALAEIRGKLTAGIWGEAETEYHDVCGPRFDLDAYLDGEPECYATTETAADRLGSQMDLWVAVDFLAYITAESAMRRGAAIMALVRHLQASGIDVRLTGYSAVQSVGHDALYTVRIADQSGAISSDRLAFALAHPAFLRRLIFSAMELSVENPGHGYGTYLKGCESCDIMSIFAGRQIDYLIPPPSSNRDFETPERAAAWLVGHARKMGLAK